MKKNPIFDFLDEVEGLPVGSTTANIEKEKRRQGYGEKRDYRKIDIFLDGKYQCSTNWAKTCHEAIAIFSKKENVNGTVTAHFSN